MSKYFYHYTGVENLEKIANGSSYALPNGECASGLYPIRRFMHLGIKGMPERAYEAVVFGLLDPLDKGWGTHEWGDSGKPVFETVLNDISDNKLALLRAEVSPGKDDIYVADYGVHLPDDYKGSFYADDPGTLRAKRDYFESLTPWAQYHDDVKRGMRKPHILPEVICFSRIPLERLKLVKKQSRYQVINAFRRVGGYAEYPPPPPPKEIDIAVFLEHRDMKRNQARIKRIKRNTI
jgi:hypothetical protein